MTHREPGRQEAFCVRQMHDSVWASARARQFAADHGLRGTAPGAVAIALSELVSNAVKFAGGGIVRLRAIDLPQPGIEICVEDDGPGIAQPSEAVRDGWSEGRARTPEDPVIGRRGLGTGLGAVMRLMDELVIEPRAPRGTRVIARKYRGRSP
ncbi:MAG TPA: ATP-binding protein [Polyangiaceae bacterium]|nr:ATP-binding protein [Polyangiaceae bacterium]